MCARAVSVSWYRVWARRCALIIRPSGFEDSTADVTQSEDIMRIFQDKQLEFKHLTVTRLCNHCDCVLRHIIERKL